MNEQEFKDKMREFDPLAGVDFDAIPMGIRVRPSNPIYWAGLCELARAYRPMGVLVSVTCEQDFFLTDPYVAPHLTFRQRLSLLLQRKFHASVGR